MAIPPPMPHPNDDPDTIAVRASKQTFTEAANKARSEHASDLFVAEKVAKLYETHRTEATEAYERLTARRRARLDYLEGLVPIGPGIPEGTSPADKAVLMQAFRAAYGQAKDATSKRRTELLAEAERFDDEAMRRGALTAAMDVSDVNLIKHWSQLHLDEADHLDEVAELRATLAGRHFNNRWDYLDFNVLPAPHEVSELPRLQAAAEAERRARMQRRGFTA
ncbi:hypothetical protein [Streptomyces sp. AC512_CC834]|uniref:hypothetical protein n=1 Tax=Streptomyces sp. AC512_CC834 TaxID=2823691 RepID=UPI001C27080E|nr:hypothetical protein [Streptomyces sp. AC512_CC834]